MEISRHFFVFAFIALLIIFVRLLLRKGELHFKMVKELYPKNFKGISSFYNPLSSLYLFGLGAETVFWFIAPIYFQKKDVSIIKNEKLILLDKKLIKNNRKIYLCLIIMIIWLLSGGYLLSH